MAKKSARNIRLKLYKQILLEADDGCPDITIIVDEDGNPMRLATVKGANLKRYYKQLTALHYVYTYLVDHPDNGVVAACKAAGKAVLLLNACNLWLIRTVMSWYLAMKRVT